MYRVYGGHTIIAYCVCTYSYKHFGQRIERTRERARVCVRERKWYKQTKKIKWAPLDMGLFVIFIESYITFNGIFVSLEQTTFHFRACLHPFRLGNFSSFSYSQIYSLEIRIILGISFTRFISIVRFLPKIKKNKVSCQSRYLLHLICAGVFS